MGVMILAIENNVEEEFRKIVKKRLGSGGEPVEIVVNRLMKNWVEIENETRTSTSFFKKAL